MTSHGLPGRTSGVVRIDSRLLARIALKAYDDCGLDYCCDPTEMAERMGFAIHLTDGTGELLGNVLLYPLMPSRRAAGLVVYQLIARRLLRNSKHRFSTDGAAQIITDELILPRIVALRVVSEDLPAVQRYAPFDTLRRIYLGHRARPSRDTIPPTKQAGGA